MKFNFEKFVAPPKTMFGGIQIGLPRYLNKDLASVKIAIRRDLKKNPERSYSFLLVENGVLVRREK